MNKSTAQIFKNGSTTYFFSSLFFPKHIRDDVATLYAFVRTADDLVDCIPPKKELFDSFKKYSLHMLNDDFSSSKQVVLIEEYKNIVQNLIKLINKTNMDKKWFIAFLESMESDLFKKKYMTYTQLQSYMYGSAEVVGLMMCCILKLEKESYVYARKLGESMQLINFIRDLQEDITLQRQYIPQEDTLKFNLDRLDHEFLDVKIPHTYEYLLLKQYSQLIKYEIERYKHIFTEAKHGFKYIPWRYRIAIQTASEMYEYTANILFKNPLLVFEKKVKPSKIRIIFTAIKNAILLLFTASVPSYNK